MIISVCATLHVQMTDANWLENSLVLNPQSWTRKLQLQYLTWQFGLVPICEYSQLCCYVLLYRDDTIDGKTGGLHTFVIGRT